MDGGQRPPSLTPAGRRNRPQDRLEPVRPPDGAGKPAESLEQRLWRLAGGRRDVAPEPDLSERVAHGDGSHEQAVSLVANLLGGTVVRHLREYEDGWRDERTRERVP